MKRSAMVIPACNGVTRKGRTCDFVECNTDWGSWCEFHGNRAFSLAISGSRLDGETPLAQIHIRRSYNTGTRTTGGWRSRRLIKGAFEIRVLVTRSPKMSRRCCPHYSSITFYLHWQLIVTHKLLSIKSSPIYEFSSILNYSSRTTIPL